MEAVPVGRGGVDERGPGSATMPVCPGAVSPGAGRARTGGRAGPAGAQQADGGGGVDSMSGVCRSDL
ncbi:hypothetical protein [Streptomyces sp. NPDC056683]|uniref:hypothetical protein n=1 Tax=Streptomyces sp. NPDC056683 TaxID=3345910 RepID=UPI0036A7C039